MVWLALWTLVNLWWSWRTEMRIRVLERRPRLIDWRGVARLDNDDEVTAKVRRG